MAISTTEWLLRKRHARVAHIWLGTDTACRLASTGGLNQRRYRIAGANPALPVCAMCQHNAQRFNIHLSSYSQAR